MHVPKAIIAVFLIIGAALVLFLNRLDTSLNNAENEVIQNRIVDCRMMVSHGLDLIDDGPCTEPTVLDVICRVDAPKDCSGR